MAGALQRARRVRRARCRPARAARRAGATLRTGPSRRPGVWCRRPGPDGKARGMTSIPLPPIPLSQAGRAAHDLGLAGLLGGNLFGRLALHPSVTEISDQEERGKVVNAAWKRYGTVNSLSLLAVVDRLGRRARRRGARPPPLARGAPAGAGQGRARRPRRRDRRRDRGGGRPLRPLGPERRRAAARRRPCRGQRHTRVGARKRRVNALGAASLVAEVALVSVNAALNQESFRRPPARRRFRR